MLEVNHEELDIALTDTGRNGGRRSVVYGSILLDPVWATGIRYELQMLAFQCRPQQTKYLTPSYCLRSLDRYFRIWKITDDYRTIYVLTKDLYSGPQIDIIQMNRHSITR
jgi:hypothetical protein